jgi:general secretion pathway protein D
MIYRFVRLALIAGSLLAASAVFAQVTTPPVVTSPRPVPAPTPSSARAAAGSKADEMQDRFVLADADIDSVLQALETYTGKTVLHPTALPTGTYSIRINHPIPKSELILALETLLFQNNVGVVPLGDRFLKVVPLAAARTEAPEFIEGSTLDLPPSGKLGTKVFQLEFQRASEIFAGGPTGGLQSLLSLNIGGGVVVLDKANSAIITDSISNLQRIELLLKNLDKPFITGFSPKFYSLQNAKAADVVAKLHALLTGPVQSQIGTATSYQSDDRTNKVIVITDPREIPFFDDLIAKMDVPSELSPSIDVIYLKHADAATLQPVLANLISGQIAAQQKANTVAPRAGDLQTVDRMNPNPTPTPLNPSPNAAANALAKASAETGTGQFSQSVTAVADERSNSIVVTGNKDDIKLMHSLVEKLDGPLAQVRIQVIIAEVTLSDTDISGIQALNLHVATDNTRGTHITTFAGGSGTLSSIAGWDFANGIVNPLSVDAALQASGAGSRNVVHVLSAPIIMTAHGKVADVQVGEQVPVITGGQTTLATTGTTPVASETTSYTNIVIDLNVTPLIGDNGDVQMTIDQKVDDIIGYTTVNNTPQPNIGHREAKSFVTVKDGQMLVLGGMQRTSKTATQNKLGFLYEIPILSQLLGGHTDDLQRTELLFFLRPTIIPAEAGSEDAMRKIEELSNRDQVKAFLKNPAPQPNSKTQNFLDRFKTKDN